LTEERNIKQLSDRFFFQLSNKVNEADDGDQLPLDVALASKQETLAKTLLEHRADINQRNSKGWTLLHCAIHRGNKRGVKCHKRDLIG
jgi:ankyrin repeat protein